MLEYKTNTGRKWDSLPRSCCATIGRRVSGFLFRLLFPMDPMYFCFWEGSPCYGTDFLPHFRQQGRTTHPTPTCPIILIPNEIQGRAAAQGCLFTQLLVELNTVNKLIKHVPQLMWMTLAVVVASRKRCYISFCGYFLRKAI